jgi:hypothetical protein
MMKKQYLSFMRSATYYIIEYNKISLIQTINDTIKVKCGEWKIQSEPSLLQLF